MSEKFAAIPGMTMIKANKSYSGSHGGMQWKVRVAGDELEVLCWPMPWCLEKTDETRVTRTSVVCSEEGLRDAEAWVEAQYEQQLSVWEQAQKERLF